MAGCVLLGGAVAALAIWEPMEALPDARLDEALHGLVLRWEKL